MATIIHQPWSPHGIDRMPMTRHDMDTIARYMGHSPSSIQELMQLIPSFKTATIPADIVVVQAILKMINQE